MQGGDFIVSKDIGLVLRILGQNPTEEQIVEMVMKVRRIILSLMCRLEWGGGTPAFKKMLIP